MKNIKTLFIALSALVLIFTACEGPEGPPGRDGFDGINGELVPTIFELAGLTFNASNNYTITEPFPNDIVIDDSDVVLVYRLAETDPANGDIWQLLPQNFFVPEGIFQYNFDHSKNDVSFFIDSNFDLTTLSNTDLLNEQIFRIAIVPAAVSNNISAKAIDYSKISKSAKLLNITD